jgi:hypothetical protein
MKALHNFLAPMLASMAMFLLVSETAVAQTLKQEIVGAWQVVSTTNEKDGKKTEPQSAGLFHLHR